MTPSQRLQLKMSETRQAANDSTNTDADRERLLGELSGLEREFRAALAAETAQINEDHTIFDAETTEFRELLNGASVETIIKAAVRGHAVAGPEAEIQQHFQLPSNAIPLQMMMPEHRAAASFGADAAEPGSSPGIAGQVFGDSAAGFLNVRVEDVPIGTRIHPIITTGAQDNVATPVRSTTVTETDVVLAVKELRPVSARVSFAYTQEDAATYAGLDAGLKENIRAGLRDKLDDIILNAVAKGLLTSAHSTDPQAPSAATTAAQYLAAIAGGVDGRYAMTEAATKMLVGTKANGVYPHMAGLQISNNGPRLTSELGGRLRVSEHIAAYAGNHQDAIVVKGTLANAVMALWPSIEIFEDRGTRAQEGEVRLYGQLNQDFVILRTGGYVRHAFRTS